MLYWLLRAIARVVLHSYYAEVRVQGRHHLSGESPVVVVSTHPNALVDAMLVATTLESKVFITARATLFDSRPLSAFLRRVGVIPLRRQQDVPVGRSAAGSATRNDGSRAQVLEVLRRRNAVLIFPEGVSDDRLHLAPLRSGAARIALQAHDVGLRHLRILPFGLIYEEKERRHSRVLVRIGAPIDVDAWVEDHPRKSPAALTRDLTLLLDHASLGFASGERAAAAIAFANAMRTARSVAGFAGAVASPREETDAGRATDALEYASTDLRARAARFIHSADTLNAQLRAHPGRSTVTSVIRDLSLAVFVFPLAIVGRAFSMTLVRIAHLLALRTLRDNRSRDQPAMRTMLIALVVLPVICGVLAVLLIPWLGPTRTLLSIVLLLAAFLLQTWDFDGLVNAVRRLPRYVFRADRESRCAALVSSARALRNEANSLALALESRPKLG